MMDSSNSAVRPAPTRGRSRCSAVAGLFVVCSLALGPLGACGGAQRPKAPAAELRAIVEPPVATVQVDEKFVGAARVLAQRPAQLKPGKHRVTVDAAGYFPHDVELDLPPGVTTLELKLRPIPR
jgi:hypothetical protein